MGSDAIAREPAAIAGIATAAEVTYSAMTLWTHCSLHHATAFFTRGKKVDESADSITHNNTNDIVNKNLCAKLVLNEDSDNKSIFRVIPNANGERYKPLFTDRKYVNQPPGKQKRSIIPRNRKKPRLGRVLRAETKKQNRSIINPFQCNN